MQDSYAKRNDCWHSIKEHTHTEYTCPDCGFVGRNTREFREHECVDTNDDPDGEREQGPSASTSIDGFLNASA
jgi:predicted RNA-binding Zn-ribbon protein involved in translation (DUF1610 family)